MALQYRDGYEPPDTILCCDVLTWGAVADPDQFELFPFSPEMWQVVDADLLVAFQE